MTEQKSDIRAFIAIELTDEIRAFLAEQIDRLKLTRADIKWIRPGSMHLTLKFLGNISPEQVDAVADAIAPVAQSRAPAELTVRSLGAFPNLRKPRVIWAGIDDPAGVLRPMAEEIDEAMHKLGHRRESRPFNPHLTIGRTRSGKGLGPLIEEIRVSADMRGPTFVADRVVLFQSTLKPSGAEYTPLRITRFSSE